MHQRTSHTQENKCVVSLKLYIFFGLVYFENKYTVIYFLCHSYFFTFINTKLVKALKFLTFIIIKISENKIFITQTVTFAT